MMMTEFMQRAIETLAVEGVAFRPFRGERDYAAMAEIVTESYAANGIEEVKSAEEIAVEYGNLANCDPFADIICADDASGQLIAFNRVSWRINEAGERVYWQFGHVLPEWRRRGIGRAMLRFTENRARAHAAAHPFGGPSFLHGVGEDTAPGKIALFENAGYKPARYFFIMQRKELGDLSQAPLPAGIELRPALPEHMRAVWNAREEAFRDHWGYATKTESDYRQWADDPKNNLGLWLIAWDADSNQIAGVCLNMIPEADNQRYNLLRGWVDVLGVRRPWRGRGLARSLLINSMCLLRERGMTEAVLGVDAENLSGALRLYESVGFRMLNRDALYRKPLE
ncbi:MAG: GNAT family N-acetyltransferase [Chloroflexi bacterium]|nr:GNAT family N-acetyltransferase [Chloroflexota bacterium]